MRIPPLLMEEAMKYNKNESPVKMAIRDALEIIAGLIMFGVLLFAFLWSVKACSSEVMAVAGRKAEAQSEEAPECAENTAYSAEIYLDGYECPGEYNAATSDFSGDFSIARKDIGCSEPYWCELLTDSRGATAERWEIEECIRELMLEAGGESKEDIREHAAVYCKQLLYTQTVGGFDDWGVTLHGIVYSHAYEETYPNIWTPAAEPTDEVREIFWDVWWNGYTSDFRVQNFRKDYYHSPIWSIPAYQIGRTCYSINIWQDFSMFE